MEHFIRKLTSHVRPWWSRLTAIWLLTVLWQSVFAQCNPDVTAPVPLCQNMPTLSIPTGQTAVFTAAMLDAGSTDNCGIATVNIEDGPISTQPPLTTELVFDGTALGSHQVVLWVSDLAGNTANCSATLTITDDCSSVPPAIAMVCNNEITVEIPAGGSVSIYPGRILEGGPYCSTYLLGILPSGNWTSALEMDESDIGTYNVRVADAATGTQCWGTVIVTGETGNCTNDQTPPTAICQGFTNVFITPGQSVVVTAASLNNGSTDNCPGPLGFFVEEAPGGSAPPLSTQLTFTEADTGIHPLVLWVVDASGNYSSCETAIDVNSDCSGGSSASMACNALITVTVPAGGSAQVYPLDILEGGPYCSEYSMQIMPSGPLQASLNFTAADAGLYVVRVRDNQTLVACWGELLVVPAPSGCQNDVTPPVAVCDAFLAVPLHEIAPNIARVYATQINDGSLDECTPSASLKFAVEPGPIPSATMPTAAYLDFSAPGIYENVILWVADAGGNTDHCTTMIIVPVPQCNPDNTDPQCIAPADTSIPLSMLDTLDLNNFMQLDQVLGAPLAWDNCALQGVLQSSELVYDDICFLPKTIRRKFRAIDAAGSLSDEQEQIITVSRNFAARFPADILPGASVQDSAQLLWTDGLVDTIWTKDTPIDFNCDGVTDLIRRAWYIGPDCPPEEYDGSSDLPRLDLNNDGIAGDAYEIIRIGDSVYVMENQLPSTLLGPVWYVYRYTQEIRYNYNDTLQPPLTGQLFHDANRNCMLDNGESLLSNRTITAIGLDSGIKYTAVTDTNGYFVFATNCFQDTAYSLNLNAPFNYGGVCPTTWTVVVMPGSTVVQNIPVQLDTTCPLMGIDIGAARLRRCFQNTYQVSYCNYSHETIEDTYVEVQLDAFMEFASSSIPGVHLGNRRYRFATGDLAPGECGRFNIRFLLRCDAALGQTHCLEAHIFPDTICPSAAAWSGANLIAEAFCDSDTVHLSIKNTGAGNMAVPQEYIVVEDVIMHTPSSFQLLSQEPLEIAFPANGQTWRIETQQVAGHPYQGTLAAMVEGCNGLQTPGIPLLFALENPNPFISSVCLENTDSFDPNDKAAAPIGFGAPHFIEPNTDLEYIIRFQNTGTDTAFTVVILDTLSALLDPLSVRPGAASHPYSFEILDNAVLRFRFAPITLPDSNVNAEASRGFVQFLVSQKPDLPLGSEILNRAAIYFDFNAPIVTNEVLHTIGHHFLEVLDSGVRPSGMEALQVAPNPSGGDVLFRIPSDAPTQAHFYLSDAQGRRVQAGVFSDNTFALKRGALANGIYFYQVLLPGKGAYHGKIVLH